MKAVEVKYGIEITKSHSKAMYDHNDRVVVEMKKIIAYIVEKEYRACVSNNIAQCGIPGSTTGNKFKSLSKAICCYGFGEGFSLGMIIDETLKTLKESANWRMHEMYQEMHEAGMVPTIEQEIIGFTNNYNKDYPKYCSE